MTADNIKLLCIILAAYYIIGSLICITVTAHDKRAAINKKRRVPEKTLILLGIFFSSSAEYLTMKAIRHKTLHKKFMLGLPAIFIMKIIIAAGACYYIFSTVPA